MTTNNEKAQESTKNAELNDVTKANKDTESESITTFEDFNLDDLEVIESKVFA